jgi:hypothetical protein
LLVWAAYFLIPNDAGGLVDGMALSPIEAAAVLAIGWLALYGGRLRFAGVAAVVAIASTVAGAAIPGNPGMRARYFASAEGTGAPERSAEFIDSAFTRIDKRLHFVPGTRDLPLNFFNDNTRYSLFQVAYTRHDQLPFAVRWTGEFWTQSHMEALYVQAPKATGEIFIDGILAARVDATDEDGESVVPLPATEGWHRLDVSLSSPYGATRHFSAGTVIAGVRYPFDASEVMTQRIRAWQLGAAGVLRIARWLFDIAALLFVGVTFVMAVARAIKELFRTADAAERRRHAMALFMVVGAIDALRASWPWATRMMLLVAGDDTATYETFARDILFNGVLMSGGKPLGQGEPFYYQAFYPYFLALEHVVGGEFMFGVVLIQRLLAAWAIVMLVRITIRFTAERAWIVALPIAAAFVGWKFWPISGQPLNEALYVPLLVAATAATIRFYDEPTTKGGIWTGVLGGFTTITRSTALLAWAVVWPAAWFALKGRPRRAAPLAILIASFLVVLSLVAIRNWIVAGVPSPIPTEGAITLLGGNEPPPGLAIDPARKDFYARFGISDITATVIEYAITEPRLFTLNLGRKALFVLGVYEPYAPGWGYSPVYLATWTTALAGLWLVVKRRQGSIWPVLIPAMISLTQFIAIVVVYPKGERLVVPVHVLLIPYCASAAWFALNSLSSDAANVNRMASRTST